MDARAATVRIRSAPALLAVLALWLTAVTGAAVAGQRPGGGAGYGPPYEGVREGGDYANLIHADPESGEMAIVRAFPFPGTFGCRPESRGGWASFVLTHTVGRPVTAVAVRYERAVMDTHSFLSVLVSTASGRWLGSKVIQGPEAGGSGTVLARLGDRSPERGQRIRVLFGLQLSSACPQVGEASARFPSVTVKEG